MTRIARTPGRGRWILLAALAGTVAVLALGTGTAAASSASSREASSTCWKDVINDWLQHEPNVVGTYAIPCYTQAIQHLESYSDIQGYSNAPEDIRRAELAAIRNQGKTHQGTTTTTAAAAPSGPTGKGNGGGPKTGGGKPIGPGTTTTPAPNRNPVTRFFDSIGPGNAQSVPLPLLVLAGLAILLLLAAAGTWIAKRIQSRRMPPPARSPASQRD